MCITFMSTISKKLGDNIARIREAKGMSQGDICRITGMDRGYISRVENGSKNPTISNLEKIAKALDVNPDELLK
ncbi:MAG: Helix-turn-helix domain protein [Candidatus Magasanikbacteria bacterium GW2011_GWA2_41_55]|uniref:Helix-turn-helix domain protein n=1 Tax=Candidatus Magasanikbacteria bacterium GW2011_GWA2_41_55 TaxID=1619038 RepID=A0A0G0WJP1_9BACT|nr:MAG: Helix-turn-helix domain protein [Candidatus Magasanikbacteria bacterium GW2011_GWA2_41_55]